MSNTDVGFDGPGLVDWIEREAKALGYRSLHHWCVANHIEQRNLSAYKKGDMQGLPGLDKFIEFAAALGENSLADVLVAAHLLSPGDIGARTPQDAVRASARISEEDKLHLIAMIERFETTAGPTRVESAPRR